MPFATYPDIKMFDEIGGTAIQNLLWGDWIGETLDDQGDWIKVRARGEEGWIRKMDRQNERVLEVNFIDVGQGDGCFIVTPDDEFILIDAGQYDNMERFLSWRFNLKYNPNPLKPLKYGIITHPDQDHYRGFDSLFRNSRFRFDTVCHNGIIERAGNNALGPVSTGPKPRYLLDIISTKAELIALLQVEANRGSKVYPTMLFGALQSNRVNDFRLLCNRDNFLPGYEQNKELSLQVLGPVPNDGDTQGRYKFEVFGDDGVTKNGHSIVLKLRYKDISMLLGGDLNAESQEFLLKHYTGISPDTNDPNQQTELLNRGRAVFEADIAKACHHGSHKFLDVFLQCLNPIATIISSGDGESHAHPRPDALGAFGKNGRGKRPLIFSTELARSAKEGVKKPEQLVQRINSLRNSITEEQDPDKKAELIARLEGEYYQLERSIAIYGMINVRTDGKRVIIAQKLESPRNPGSKYDIHKLEFSNGELKYKPD
jgi:beta-lactamase superfamily II metal-dependent hydrolase